MKEIDDGTKHFKEIDALIKSKSTIMFEYQLYMNHDWLKGKEHSELLKKKQHHNWRIHMAKRHIATI